MKQGIFISYRRADSAFFAARLHDRLEELFPGLTFIDVAGIAPGADFVDRIAGTLAECKVVIAIIGKDWLRPAQDATEPDNPREDYVTFELQNALGRDIAVIPVLVEDAQIPDRTSLPAELHALARRNAIRVSHARFESDLHYLFDELYPLLGIKPPTRLEKLLEWFPNSPKVDEKARSSMALWSLCAGVVSVLFGVVWLFALDDPADELGVVVGFPVVGLVLGIIGINSSRRRRIAVLGVGLSGAALLGGLVLLILRADLLAPNAWLENYQIAQSDISEIPGESLHWSRHSPFNGPPPSTTCDCLALVEEPSGPKPFAEDVTALFRNDCANNTAFVVSRSDFPGIDPALLWANGPGREFAHITLLPAQTVRIPVGGTYGGAYLPWNCGA